METKNKYEHRDVSKLFIESEKGDKSGESSRRSSTSSSSSSALPLPLAVPRRASSVLGSPYPPTSPTVATTAPAGEPELTKHQQQRSQSLVNLPQQQQQQQGVAAVANVVTGKLSRLWAEYGEGNNAIEEDERGQRRGSLQYDRVDGLGRRLSRNISVQPSTATISTTLSSGGADPFGPQLSSEQLSTLPGTPLPALLPGALVAGYTDLGAAAQNLFDDGELVDGEFGAGEVPTPPDKDEPLEANTLYFRDGKRKIDMVLVFEEEDLGVMTEAEARRRDNRKTFQENLRKEGLELELETKERSFDCKTFFLKIHIPWKTKTRYAAVMNLKYPVKRFIPISVKAWDRMQSNVSLSRSYSDCSTCMFEPRGTTPVLLAASKNRGDEKSEEKNKNFITKWRQYFRNIFEYNHELIDEEPSFYMATHGDREEQFIVKDRITSYSSAQRSLIVMQILLRVKYDEADKVGIRRLLNDGTYIACFPLHEGSYEKDEADGSQLDRRLLYLEWARPAKWYKKQPLNLVRKYFGDKIGLYFCWLGFYTKMLYAPAIVGTLCFFYGLLTMDSDDNIPSKEICDPDGPGNITLCPLCDKACQYQKLKESCVFARLTYLFDNPATVFFAIFMSIWATVFLELWRRKETVVQWEWDLQNVERDEESRPEFETSVKTFRTNPVTREKEPYLPTWSRTLRFFATGSAVFFMIIVVLGAVLGTIIYRISLVSVIYSGGGYLLRKHVKIFTSMTAALINLVIIMTLTRLYHKLAIWLTNMENPRTQTEYEDSYTFKIFLFEFMNFYSSLIYIAFFKGRFFDYPGDTISRQSEFLRVKGDVCDPAGCLSELCIQLAIIMIGKQCFNNIMEILNPKFYNWIRQRNHRHATKDLNRVHTRWEEDYHLQDPGRLALFDEYLEMILQYGFVTLFVAAFPLAPLCALLNNIVEIRLDAYKMVTQARRPLAERVEDIGAWFGILRVITYAAVVSNAFVIAYTSDFIPRMVFKYKYSDNDDLVGYINSSLSVFNTSHYTEDMGSDVDDPDPPTCRYRGYRNPADGPNEYDLSPQYWHVFAARLAFVVIFEHIVFSIVGIMQYAIPDVPSELQTQIQRENLLAKEAKYEHGLRRNSDFEYGDVVNTLRENNNASRAERSQGLRGSWARRLSKISDGLDAHVEVTGRQRNSTVWEVT